MTKAINWRDKDVKKKRYKILFEWDEYFVYADRVNQARNILWKINKIWRKRLYYWAKIRVCNSI